MYTAFERSQMTPGQDGMRCALDPFRNTVLGDFFLTAGFQSAGFDRCAICWFVSKPDREAKNLPSPDPTAASWGDR